MAGNMMTISRQDLASTSRSSSLSEIEAGAFGTVRVEILGGGDVVAVKYIRRGPTSVGQDVLNEIVRHRFLYHPNLMLFRKVILTSTELGIVIEHLSGGNLENHVKRCWPLQEVDARGFFQQIVVAYDFLERKGVPNRGLKLCNVLLDKSQPPRVKVTDVGYWKSTQDTLPKSRVGSFGYVAPEMLLNKKDVDTKKADAWSIGVMLYQLLVGEHPFEKPVDLEEGSVKRTLQRILKVEYRLPAHASSVSPEALDLLRHILVEDPTQRYSLQDIQAHQWFQRGLPAALTTVNEECMRMEPSDAHVEQPLKDMVSAIEHAMQPVHDDEEFHGGEEEEYGDDYLDELMES